jgi:hypothetical protein
MSDRGCQQKLAQALSCLSVALLLTNLGGNAPVNAVPTSDVSATVDTTLDQGAAGQAIA